MRSARCECACLQSSGPRGRTTGGFTGKMDIVGRCSDSKTVCVNLQVDARCRIGICISLHVQNTGSEELDLEIFILLFRHNLYFPTRHRFISSLSSFRASLEPNYSLAGPLALSRGNRTSKTSTLYITDLEPLTNSSVAESIPGRHDTHKRRPSKRTNTGTQQRLN